MCAIYAGLAVMAVAIIIMAVAIVAKTITD